jgi:hypothetical protein
MSFLDNLESSLKSLESREERDPREHQRKKDERARALAVGPWAEQLKNSTYVQHLCDQAAIAGHRLRTKIYMAWFDGTLRLEARQRQLELRPTPDGIVAAFIEPDREMTARPLDLRSKPEDLLKQWLGS